jgi:hypothetical protein
VPAHTYIKKSLEAQTVPAHTYIKKSLEAQTVPAQFNIKNLESADFTCACLPALDFTARRVGRRRLLYILYKFFQ